jgi:NADPH2:quinone reductase
MWLKAVRVHEHGGPEVLRYEEAPLPVPGPGEARVRIGAVGINFIDIYYRTGLYKAALPVTIGSEAAGVVDAVGPDVDNPGPGDRVAYALHAPGTYAEFAIAPAWRLVPLPPSIDDTTAAAVMLQGMTVHYLTHSTYPLKRGETALIHAAAGGLGLLLVQAAKRLGARVLGTVSTEEKARLAREAGADEVILYTREDFEEAVRRLTGGRGVDIVYDSVGKDTAEKSINCVRPRGFVVLFGNSSGRPPLVDPLTLMSRGSLFLTRPTLPHYTQTREEVRWRAGDLFRWIAAGELTVRIAQTFPLARAADAHRLLESRTVSGKLVLVP